MKVKYLKFVTCAMLLIAVFVILFQLSRENIKVINSSSGRSLPIYSVDTQEKNISLTFDSAWNVDDLDQILDILNRCDVKATFFVTGEWVEKYPDEVKKLVNNGHELGNHGDNHKHMTQLSKEEKIEEMTGCHNKVKDIAGTDMILFRPPYGDYDDEVINEAIEYGYYPIQWDVDTLNAKRKNI